MQLEAKDARGVTVTLRAPPQRIISLVPSTTETLFDLGLGEKVIGVTRFCVHPKDLVQSRTKIGGTKDVDIERVLALKPDLVIGNCEENTRELFEALEPQVPLYAGFPKTVDDAIHEITQLATLVGAPQRGEEWAQRIQENRLTVHERKKSFRYAYLIWRDPWMTVSDDTFISAMLSEAGGQNLFAQHQDRFPSLQLGDLMSQKPDVVLLSSEPFPFKEKHLKELEAFGLHPRLIHGEYCSWHGTRMAAGFQYLANRLQSDTQDALFPPRMT